MFVAVHIWHQVCGILRRSSKVNGVPIIDSLVSVIAPHACLGCGVEGELLCGSCSIDAYEQVPSRCYRCKRLTNSFATCPTCRRIAPITNVWVSAHYDGITKQLLGAFKFDRARAAASIIARQMADELPLTPADIIIIPVPTATSRVRQRGYDQSEILAKELSGIIDRKCVVALARLTQSRQLGADRKHRLSQLEGAFVVAKSSIINKANILLIDDVVTTGATLETVAKLLRKSGAKSISALIFAQK